MSESFLGTFEIDGWTHRELTQSCCNSYWDIYLYLIDKHDKRTKSKWRVRISSEDGKIEIDDRPPPSPKKQ